MLNKPIAINRCDVYITRNGRLVFIEVLDRDEAGAITQVRGYSISGARSGTTKKWRTWSVDGRVVSGQNSGWDIIKAI